MRTIQILFIALLALPVVAFGVSIPIVVPDGDALQSLLALVANWKSAQPLAIGSMVVTLIVQLVKQFAPEFKYKRFLVTVLGVLYGFFLGLSQGMGLFEVAISALFISGGAVAIYEALKPTLQKIGL